MSMWCAIAIDKGYFTRGGIRSVVFEVNFSNAIMG
jgi:hypothetical protein